MNTDQGAQLASEAWIEEMKRHEGLKISMDGTGCWVDNVFIERLCFETINLNLLIADVVKKSFLDIEGDKIRVEKKLDERINTLQADLKSLSNSLHHILRNSLEALQDKEFGLIEIYSRKTRVWKNEPAILIMIRDNGDGISPDIREKVFSPLCTTKPRGMGLGLPLAKRMTIDHNGTIKIKSSARGTRVMIILPLQGHNSLTNG